jgi:hypothetical protein
MPHSLPLAPKSQPIGVHVPASRSAPHTEGTPAPPQLDPLGHGPQLSDPPQLSPIMPQ